MQTFEQWFQQEHGREPDVKGVWYDRDQKRAYEAGIAEGRHRMLPSFGSADGANSFGKVDLRHLPPTGTAEAAAHAVGVWGT